MWSRYDILDFTEHFAKIYLNIRKLTSAWVCKTESVLAVLFKNSCIGRSKTKSFQNYSRNIHLLLSGFYQPETKRSSCKECRPGYYCENFEFGGEQLCPPYSFCPSGLSLFCVQPYICSEATMEVRGWVVVWFKLQLGREMYSFTKLSCLRWSRFGLKVLELWKKA